MPTTSWAASESRAFDVPAVILCTDTIQSVTSSVTGASVKGFQYCAIMMMLSYIAAAVSDEMVVRSLFMVMSVIFFVMCFVHVVYDTYTRRKANSQSSRPHVERKPEPKWF
jgi:hypothetical protein